MAESAKAQIRKWKTGKDVLEGWKNKRQKTGRRLDAKVLNRGSN